MATREHVISRHEDLDVFSANHPLNHLYGGENAYLLKDYVKPIRYTKLKKLKILGPYDSVINFFCGNFFYKNYLTIRTIRDNKP